MLARYLNLVFLFSIAAPCPVIAEIYNWQDADGAPVFGDQPLNIPSEPVSTTPTNIFNTPLPKATPSITAINQVTLYTASWCGFCQKARAFFREQNIKFVEYDIEKSVKAASSKKLLDKKYQGTGIPLAIINGQPVYGFQPASYLERLN